MLGLRKAFHVVDSVEISTPTVIGWLSPIVVLPIAALATLTPAQVEAILAHELAHIRRHDCLVNLMQIVGETLLFYHPAVWWISARIRIEREHCCDQVAASTCDDVVTYAEALLTLERWRADLPSLALGATRGPLLRRIRWLLGVPDDDGHRSTTGIALAGMVMVFVTLAGASIYLRAAQADSRPTAVDPDDAAPWHMVFSHDDMQMRFIGFGGRDLVRFAYQVPAARVIGGPSWIDEEILPLVVSLDAAPRADEMPDVVRRVLEDKLHLQTHVEQRNFPVLALERSHPGGSLGPNLQPSTLDCFDVAEWVANGQPPRALPPAVPRQPVCGEEVYGTPIGHREYVAITMQQFADEWRHIDSWLTPPGRRTLDIVDRTGLTGRYDVAFESFVPAVALMARYPVLTNVFEPLGFLPLSRALGDQLGLRLRESEAPYDVIVIDSVERPIP
ncbi:MAG TPA: M56 family metallopeptidase [Vicinamibacterales bacterium]|nr:M56 family metallopeptidase [Vicinamibacterales bacterium]